MIRRLLGLVVTIIACVCVATCVAQAVLVGVGAAQGKLGRDRLVQMLAVFHGIDLAQAAQQPEAAPQAPQEQVSLDEIAEARAVHVRHLELREQAIKGVREQVEFQEQKLVDEKKHYMKVKEEFEARLLAIQKEAEGGGAAELTAILEKIKAAQAKEQILKMLQDGQMDEVVALLGAMQDSKRAKIIGEFKTAEESAKLAEVLRRILEGAPASELADRTKKQLVPAPPNP